MERARQEALETAAARAQQMVTGLNITLGKPISVMETGGGYPNPHRDGGRHWRRRGESRCGRPFHLPGHVLCFRQSPGRVRDPLVSTLRNRQVPGTC